MRFLYSILFLVFPLYAYVATVGGARGEVYVVHQGSVSELHTGDRIERKDEVFTKKGILQLIFKDETVVTLGQNSRMKIEEYLYDNKPQAQFFFQKGVFRTLTGKIGKIAPERFKLKTKNATIGIRGTEILVKVLPGQPELIACTLGAIEVVAHRAKQRIDIHMGQMVQVMPEGSLLAPRPVEPKLFEEVLMPTRESWSKNGEKKKVVSSSNLLNIQNIKEHQLEIQDPLNYQKEQEIQSAVSSSLASSFDILQDENDIPSSYSSSQKIFSSELSSELSISQSSKSSSSVVITNQSSVSASISSVSTNPQSSMPISGSYPASISSSLQSSFSSPMSQNSVSSGYSSSVQSVGSVSSSNSFSSASSTVQNVVSSAISSISSSTSQFSSTSFQPSSVTISSSVENSSLTTSQSSSVISSSSALSTTVQSSSSVVTTSSSVATSSSSGEDCQFGIDCFFDAATSFIGRSLSSSLTSASSIGVYDNEYMGFGYWADEKEKPKEFWVVGEPTHPKRVDKLIRNNAKASYRGRAAAQTGSGVATGDFRMDVDFGQRKVGGAIDLQQKSDHWAFGFDGRIKKSGFESAKVFTLPQSTKEITTGKVEGSFYGPNAEAVGGTFQINNSIQGAFGGERSPQK